MACENHLFSPFAVVRCVQCTKPFTWRLLTDEPEKRLATRQLSIAAINQVRNSVLGNCCHPCDENLY